MNARIALAAAALVLALAFAGGSARATTTFTVDTTADAAGDCSVAGQCTLRAAVTAANGSAGTSTILLPAGTYTLTGGALDVTGTLEIDGAGAAATVIDGNAADRVFHTENGSSLTLTGLRITNGKSLGGSAVFAEGTLSLTDVTLDHNDAQGGSGGALLLDGPATVRDVTITNNTAGQGGGIWAQGDLAVISSTFSHNAVTASGANGGGIATHGGTFLLLDSVVSDNTVDVTGFGSTLGEGGGVNASAGRTVIDSTTISDNSVTASGANVSFAGGLVAGPNTTITNSTISGNSADSSGGVELAGRFSIVNTTITGNVTNNAFQPGGVRVDASSSEIVDSTIADNLPTNLTTIPRVRLAGTVLQIGAAGANCSGGGFPLDIVSGGGNVASDVSCGLSGPGDVQNQDLLLGPLQDNGGGVPTRLPGAGSPALGAVTAGAPPTDARGVFRPTPADAGAADRTADNGVGVTVGMPATLIGGDTIYAIVTLRNRTSSGLTGASVTFDGTTRTIGALAAGESDVEIFRFTAPNATSCVDSATSYAFAAAWNGTTHGGSVPVKVSAACGGVKGLVTANALPVADGKVDVCLTTLATCTETTTNALGKYEALVPNGSYTIKAYPTASSPATATATTVGPVSIAAPAVATQDVGLTPVGPPPPNVVVSTPLPPAANGVVTVPKGFGAPVTLSAPCGSSAPTGWTIASGGVVVASGTFTQVGSTTTYSANIPARLPIPTFGIGFFAAACGSAPAPAPWPFRYYDPSGTVKDANGNPVAGASVTLSRADSASGPFTVVPNGSDVMSPENRRNPDTTLDDGTYAWDVTGGFYTVHAEKNGCTADSAVLTVPPPATGIDLVLACPPAPAPSAPAPAAATPVSSSGSGSSAAPAATPPAQAPAPVVVPAVQAAPTIANALLHVRHVRGTWIETASFSVDETVVLRVRALGTAGRPLALAPGSVVAGVRTGRPHPDLVARSAAGAVTATLRTSARPLQLELVATNSDGTATRLLVPVR